MTPSGLRGGCDATSSRSRLDQPVSYVVRAVALVAGLVAATGLLAGCGGKANPSSAAAPPSAGFQAYVDCLRQHGVTITVPSGRPSGRPSGVRPSRVRPSGVRPSGVRPSGGGGGFGGGGFGGGGFPGLGNEPPSGVDQQTWDAAQQACAAVRPSFGPRAGGSAMTAYRNCLRDHGVTATGDPRQLSTADPKVAAAIQACAPLLPTARPSPTG